LLATFVYLDNQLSSRVAPSEEAEECLTVLREMISSTLMIRAFFLTVWNGLRNDPWDLSPGERIIREQRWAEVGGTGDVPEWPIIYKQELDRAEALNEADVILALNQAVTSVGNEWAAAQPDAQQTWAEKITNHKAAPLPEKKALLRQFLAARQAFYANLRQETVYRGKTILLSSISLAWGLLTLLACLTFLGVKQADTGSLSSAQGSVLAAACGWAGGAFTWLTANRRAVATSSIGTLREISRWPYTISRAMIGSFAGFVIYAALAANVIANPTPALFADRASIEEKDRAREIFRGLLASAKVPPDTAANAEMQLLRDLDTKFREVRLRSDREWLQMIPTADPQAVHPLTTAVANSLQRSTNPFWMLVFVCILAGFSETLVPSLLETSGKKLEAATR
jgi:hypothetical protein